MQNLNFLIKPASSQCNMRCRYCFYADEAAVRCGQSAAGMTRPEAETCNSLCSIFPRYSGLFQPFVYWLSYSLTMKYDVVYASVSNSNL